MSTHIRSYTLHRLTDDMLKRLSAAINGRPHKWGTSWAALEKRGLVNDDNSVTDAGRVAFEQARREGW